MLLIRLRVAAAELGARVWSSQFTASCEEEQLQLNLELGFGAVSSQHLVKKSSSSYFTIIGTGPGSSHFPTRVTAVAAAVLVVAILVMVVRTGAASVVAVMATLLVVIGMCWLAGCSGVFTKSQRLDLDVEPQYTGARIEGDVVTLDFVKKMMDDFKNQKCLHKRYAFQIVLQTREMLRALPSLVDINVPDGKHFTVCGDVHGQFYDLLNIFELNGLPSEENPYLFNGDFVDRGSFSVEVILTLFAFKCMSPSGIYLSRGNHESKNMNKIYGFEGEVRSKLNETFVELFAEVFCCIPLAHVINEKIFVVHGGLFSVDGVKLSDIQAIDRFCEPPEEGMQELVGPMVLDANQVGWIRLKATQAYSKGLCLVP
ncbi:unnamed protein product [Ilex paraguariensis]|uniref:protein-serine/threonine phosphatase n=1 Tax=Ilex paraguariensis TaxID=185542 RepID=A0ABC8U5R7_9AQUA